MFEQEQKQIINSLRPAQSAQSWIVVGPKGVGKREFAENLVHNLTSNFADYNSAAKWIRCGLTDAAKSEIQKTLLAGKNLEEKSWSKKTHITVDDVREGCKFLSLKSDKIRILVFDLADDMNENAQNALLKTLEEPYPNTLILLLCENVGHLLPTVLSRCQKLYLRACEPDIFKVEIQKRHPDISVQALDQLSFLSNNVIGLAERIIKLNALEVYDDLMMLLQNSADTDYDNILSFSEKVSKDNDLYGLVKEFILKQLAFWAEQESVQNLANAHLKSLLYTEVEQLFNQVEGINLDKKQAMFSVLYKIKESL